MQLSEVIGLALGLGVLPILVLTVRRTKWRRYEVLRLTAFSAVVGSYVLTVAEGVGGGLGDWLNVLEHACLMLGGVLFVAAELLHRRDTAIPKGVKR